MTPRAEPIQMEGGPSGAVDTVVRDVIARRLAGEHVPDEAVLRGHPDLRPHLAESLGKLAAVERARRHATPAPAPPPPARAAEPSPRAGAASIGRYRIVRRLSRGGQAVVYLARDEPDGALVAVKVLRDGVLADEAERSRFGAEAEVLASLHHPNVVPVLDRGTTAEGLMYLVMPYVAGEPLAPEALADRPLADRLRPMVAIARAVQAAHARGIVHRDLKPSNVRLSEDGAPHVLDFGLAHAPRALRGSAARDESMTVTGQFMGSLLWASPEQVAGRAPATPASDVYALGVILHQLATGGRFPPHVVRTMRDALDEVLMVAERPPPSPPAATPAGPLPLADVADPRLATMIARCLEPDPADRYPDAGALADDLERFLAGTATASDAPEPAATAATAAQPAQAPSGPRHPVPALRRGRRSVLAAAAAAAAVLLAGAAAITEYGPALWGRGGRPPAPAPLTDEYGRWHSPTFAGTADGFLLARIPPGRFTMGSPPTQPERLPDEAQHEATIARPFWIGIDEVSQLQFKFVMGYNPSRFRGDDLPVESVTWHEAAEFCRRLSRREGRHYRLPTEAEWEYACRAGATTAWSFGDNPVLAPRYANYADRSNPDRLPWADADDDGFPYTAPVDSKLPNAWRLYDMHGNVWEWCGDAYAADYPADPVPVRGLPRPGQLFSARGGSWYDRVITQRAGGRNPLDPGFRNDNLGFRVLLEDDPPARP